jgi:hypothetical protein
MEKKIILRLRSRRVEINNDRIDIFAGSFTPGRSASDMPDKPDIIELMTEGLLRAVLRRERAVRA